MARTRIAGAFVAVLLTSCSVEEPVQSLRVEEPVQSPRVAPMTTADTSGYENAGLRADFNAP